MSEVKSGLWYSEEHEWVQDLGNGSVRIGITDFAQHRLGDIVFVELPDIDTKVEAEDGIGTIESVKTVSDLFTPVSGHVTAINGELESAPELVNNDPYGAGWMVEIRLSEDSSHALGKLLNEEAYRKHTEE
ncbi:glycine cleavage system protein GcvH [Paenibacillus sp. CAA11]|uniref:glycine cleavage system protein GcvH n=1 Tax=Paenibacillus sp. CAA11 TaxID=1532905 RepID=UPI000D355290|nr:glycine cleavage system protein GcvH [Paenibacillus sp. CAA11]AWB44958.1 glycine cleavage system protein GcvH [Paenibacillus sp. CAA11]